MYRGMVVCDSDGTLLPFGEITPDKSVIEMINQLVGAGYLFFVASGRNCQTLRDTYREVDSKIGYICCNGVEIIYRGQYISEPKYMDHNLASQVINDALSREGQNLTVSTGDTVYLFRDHSHLSEQSYYSTNVNVKYVDTMEEIDGHIHQIVVSEENGDFNYRAHLRDKWGDKLNIFSSGPNMLDITHCNKGNGLLEAAVYFGIPVEHIYAFGDSDNDMSMLEAAGHGYLMESANEELKAKFPRHCTSVVDVCSKIIGDYNTI